MKGKRLSTKINNNPDITCNDRLLTNVMNVKLLGLEVDEELSFSEHITTVCKTVTQRIGLLKKIMNYLPLKQRLLYYNALIRPVINYASVLWTNCNNNNNLFIYSALFNMLGDQKRITTINNLKTIQILKVYNYI